MNKLVQEGLKVSQNLIFNRMVKKAPFFLAAPAKLGILLTTAYGILTKGKGNGQSGFSEIKDTMATVLRMVKMAATGNYSGIAKKTLLLGVGVILYLVSPIDLIPDFLPFIGLMDDISLMTWFITSIQDEIEKFEKWEINQNFDQAPVGFS